MERNLTRGGLFDRLMLWLLLLVGSFYLDGCRAIGAIFKAGVWVGVIVVIVIIAIVGGIVWAIGRGGRGGGGPA